MTSEELIALYTDFFKEKGHTLIPGASLIPENDSTILFTPAGMQPLVPYLLGRDPPRPPFLSELPGDHPRLALVDFPHKLVWDLRLNRRSLFHLEEDPGELRNLAEESPQRAQRLMDRLGSMRIELKTGRLR